MTEIKIKGWYIAEYDLLTTAHGPSPQRLPIREGETLTLPEGIVPRVCLQGYHASERLLHALDHRAEGRITLVEVFDDVDVGYDKVAGRSRKTLRIVPKDIADRECRLFAADVAERLLEAERKAGREPAAETFAAVEIARRFALGDADETELEESRQAAQAWASGGAGVGVRPAEATREAERAAWAAAAATTREAERGAIWAELEMRNARAWARAAARGPITIPTRRELSLELENRLLKAIGEEP